MAKAPTLRSVREAHNAYGDAVARWGEDNMETMRRLSRYWDLRNAYEATGKVYKP